MKTINIILGSLGIALISLSFILSMISISEPEAFSEVPCYDKYSNEIIDATCLEPSNAGVGGLEVILVLIGVILIFCGLMLDYFSDWGKF